MKIATWNVNSLRVRLPHLLDWLAANSPDAMCLQETKCEDATFPAGELTQAGYCEQSRVIAAEVDGILIVSVYVPNGQSVGSDKYAYKLRWFEALAAWLEAELAKRPRIAVLGDFNVAPEDRDVHDPQAWAGQVLFSEPERGALRRLVDIGFVDSFRLFEQPEKSFSWWDYRMGAFRRNMGLRIDHVLLSRELARACRSCSIDVAPRRLERPSDHAPLMCEIEV